MWQALSRTHFALLLDYSSGQPKLFFYYPYDNWNKLERKHTEDRTPSHPPLTHPITNPPSKVFSCFKDCPSTAQTPISHRSHLCIFSPYVYILWVSKCHCHSSQSSRPFFLWLPPAHTFLSLRGRLCSVMTEGSLNPHKKTGYWIYKYIKKFLYDYDILNA